MNEALDCADYVHWSVLLMQYLLTNRKMPENVSNLLEQMCLQKYAPYFLEQEITLDIFWTLKDEDLKRIGIKLLGPRKKLCNAIARYHDGGPVFTDVVEATYADHKRNKAEEAENRAHMLNCELSEASTKLDGANVLNKSLTNTVAITRDTLLRCKDTIAQCKLSANQVQTECKKGEASLEVIWKLNCTLINSFDEIQSIIDNVGL